MPTYDAVIVGGGFAGLSAAVDLAARGALVIVVEGRPMLGGRATSYRDRVTGDDVDNGQHVLFGCYRETFRFLRAIGADGDVRLQPRLGVSYVNRDGRKIRFACPDLPVPLHLLGGVVEWDELSVAEKLAGLRMAGLVRQLRQRANDGLPEAVVGERETARDWLLRPSIKALVWPARPRLRECSPSCAVLARRTRPLGSRVVRSRCSTPFRLVGLLSLAVGQFGLARLEGPRSSTAVLSGSRRGVSSSLHRSSSWPSPGSRCLRYSIPPPPSLLPVLERQDAMGSVPIVSVYLWFDTSVLPEAFLGLQGMTMQWVFDKRAASGPHGTHLTLVSSGAETIVGLSNTVLIELELSDLRSAVPAARDVAVSHAPVILERRATFSLAPGEPGRPGSETVIRGLYLAGDWIETGLPSTISRARW